MYMINVMKRLAELDAKNPNMQKPTVNTISENTQIEECGMMGMPETGQQSHSPASIHITANDGQELSGMLRDIMQLAGVSSAQAPQDDSEILSTEPAVSVTDAGSAPADSMRAVIDKLHSDDGDSGFSDSDEEEQADECYDNSPEDPSSAQAYDSDAQSYHPNSPGSAKGRGFTANPRAVPTMEQMEQRLFADYQNFIEDSIAKGHLPEGYEDNKAAAAKAPSAADRAKSRDAQRSTAAKKARMDAQKKGTWQDKDGTGYVGKKPAK